MFIWIFHHLGEASVGKILIENGAEVNARDNDNETPLHFCAGEGSRIYSDFYIWIFLWKIDWTYNIFQGNDDMVKLLIENGAFVNARDVDEQTPIFWSAEDGNQLIWS